jgi:hypothetical protein
MMDWEELRLQQPAAANVKRRISPDAFDAGRRSVIASHAFQRTAVWFYSISI